MIKPDVKKNTRRRRGVAAVEFAVCLPVLVVLVMAAIECTSMIFVDQSLHVVAYEGARMAIKRDSSSTDVRNRCQQVIGERSIVNAAVELVPPDIASVPRGEQILVRVSAPSADNAIVPLNFFSGQLAGQAVMIKE